MNLIQNNQKQLKEYITNQKLLKRYKDIGKYEEDIKHIADNPEYSDTKKCLLIYYVDLGVSPDLILKYINPKMKFEKIFNILELLLWDKEPYEITDLSIKLFDDTHILSMIADSLMLKLDVLRYIKFTKNISKEKHLITILMSPYFDSIDSDDKVLEILKDSSAKELKCCFFQHILSQNYDNVNAYDGTPRSASVLYHGVIDKNIGIDKLNKYIREDHRDKQIEAIIRALINIDDENVLKMISDPRHDPDQMLQLIKRYINPPSERLYLICEEE